MRTERIMAPGRPSKKAGQPHPELNFVVDLYSGVAQPAQAYVPSSKNLSYSPVPRGLIHITNISNRGRGRGDPNQNIVKTHRSFSLPTLNS